MQIKIMFGSTSDSPVYEALTHRLSSQHSVDFAVLSAHRTPDQLSAFLKANAFDIAIAGAGLSAHLPGVVASQVIKPTIGLPIDNKLAGIDALLSILQMPFGIPVLTAGVDCVGAITNFVEQLHVRKPKKLCLIKPQPHLYHEEIQREVGKMSQLADEWGVHLDVRQYPDAQAYNMVMISNDSDLSLLASQDSCVLACVPMLDSSTAANPETALTLLRWTKQGGLWLGINNLRNAFLSYVQTLNNDNSWNDRLWAIRRR
jgi:5-(carboxyamino)imidazole ribonucleotide mutase